MSHHPLSNEPRGDVLLPDDDGYAAAATTFFARGRPALVVRPRDTDGVAAAVRHARREGLVLSVRSGGHALLGSATNDGGLVLDLAHLDAVEVAGPDEHADLFRAIRGGADAFGAVAEGAHQ